jgi:long-chain acyl-CoA synthetase
MDPTPQSHPGEGAPRPWRPPAHSTTSAEVRAVPALFLHRVEATPDDEAFRYPERGGWTRLTWRDTARRVRAIACGLRALGLEDEERCAILSSTRIEWILADLGVLCAGGATTTIYPSTTAEECAFIAGDSESAYAFVEDAAQLAKLRERRAELPRLRRVIVFDVASAKEAGDGDGDDGWVMGLAELEAVGSAADERAPERFEAIARAVPGEALATLVYTSGTTGRPKGVELLHGGWVAQAEAVDRAGILDHPHRLQYFWLPLSHVFGKMIGTAQLRIGFPTAVDGRVEKLVENLAAIRPTFVAAVPRIFEKVHGRILQQAQAGGRAKRALFDWAIAVGRERVRAEQEGRAPGPWLSWRWALADRLVFRRIRATFGGRLRFFISGSAPLSRDVAEFFAGAGIVILEGYGLTESSAATHANLPSRPKLGTVGPALPGVEVRIAEDGEILMRGPWVMRGYHGLPEATAEALEGGWLHTGDVGALDPDGYLSITDRKKDLIKTSGGKYVAPQELEGRLKALSPLLSQALVHGDRRAYVSALVTLDPLAVGAWAGARGLGHLPPEELAQHELIRAELRRAVDALNATLPRFAAIRRFTALPREFSEAAGEVTASMKLKRKVIEQRYRAVLDSMYGPSSP